MLIGSGFAGKNGLLAELAMSSNTRPCDKAAHQRLYRLRSLRAARASSVGQDYEDDGMKFDIGIVCLSLSISAEVSAVIQIN